jgi:HdeA/HdeB family
MNRMKALAIVIAAGLVITAGVFAPRWADAQKDAGTRVIKLDTFTCGELMALPNDQRDRVLIYFNGFMGGLRKITTWDERVEGELVERAIRHCKADTSETALNAFTRATSSR